MEYHSPTIIVDVLLFFDMKYFSILFCRLFIIWLYVLFTVQMHSIGVFKCVYHHPSTNTIPQHRTITLSGILAYISHSHPHTLLSPPLLLFQGVIYDYLVFMAVVIDGLGEF